jgi:hypothetical protein
VRLAAAAVILLMSAAAPGNVLAQTEACRQVRAAPAGFLEQCGNELKSFSLNLSENKLHQIRRRAEADLHGRFSFPCAIEPMCEGEPLIGGVFFAPESWQKSTRDEKAIHQLLQSSSLMARRSGQEPAPELPASACPVFDVSVDGVNGRAVCFNEQATKTAHVIAVVADDRVGFVLTFSQKDQSANALRDKVIALVPRFSIERASGDAALLRWMR